MMTANGRADIVGSPIQLGDFLPEKATVTINGRFLEAWVVTNRRYPRRIQAQLDRYYNHYERAIAPLKVERDSEEFDEIEYIDALEKADEEYHIFVTNALMALVSGLSEAEAELIPLVDCERVLRQLGYFKKDEVEQPSGKSRSEKGDEFPLIGDTSLADSAEHSQVTTTPNS